jgi:hypothetical protein
MREHIQEKALCLLILSEVFQWSEYPASSYDYTRDWEREAPTGRVIKIIHVYIVLNLYYSVADPDPELYPEPYDPYCFRAPESGSIFTRIGSRSGTESSSKSFYNQAK